MNRGYTCCFQVMLNAAAESNFEAVLELFTAGGAFSHLLVTAAVVAPQLAVTPTMLDLGVTHLGVPKECSLTLSNLTMLPTSFSWEAFGLHGAGFEAGELGVKIEPPLGRLQPGENSLVVTSL